MNQRLENLKNIDCIPFDVDFLREIGIEIGKDWDGELIINYPDDIPQRMRDLVEDFKGGIKKRLWFEGEHAKSCYIGGPYNGKPYWYSQYHIPNKPVCFHIERKKWAVYMVKSIDDPRAWFMGYATSKEKGKLLKFESA